MPGSETTFCYLTVVDSTKRKKEKKRRSLIFISWLDPVGLRLVRKECILTRSKLRKHAMEPSKGFSKHSQGVIFNQLRGYFYQKELNSK